MPKVKESLTKLGAEPLGTSPAAFTKLIASEIDRWTALAEKYHIRMN
jgi:tripartite-type tricarboxylate transporter receptor subunit TctC